MKVTIAIDSYKGSMTSLEAGIAAKEGILRVKKDACVQVFPIADGGEGTVDALTYGKKHCRKRNICVTGPIGIPVHAAYMIYDSEHGKTAVIEMAAAAGLALVPLEKRNPMHTTTYGVGEMIKDAIREGCRQFIIGIGGSATNDGGIGMLQALGYQFLDVRGEEVPFGSAGLLCVSAICSETVMPEIVSCEFRVMCDVKNPLLGNQGCSAIFAPQKGADAPMIEQMEQGMQHYADLVEHFMECEKGYDMHKRVDRYSEGTGAAGGLGYAFLMFLHATLDRGVDVILHEIGIEQAIVDSDYVITGEGRLDAQTVMGKAPAGVAALAKKYGKTVLAFAGSIGEGAEMCCTSGMMDAYYAITNLDFNNMSEQERLDRLAYAMQKEHAMQNMEDKVAEVFEQGMVSWEL